nr:putative ATP-grasp-modified RiPP [Streptomyces sp. NBC_00857]
MPVLTRGAPPPSKTTASGPRGPLATRPFGLDALTVFEPVPFPPSTSVAVDPVSQLSLADGEEWQGTGASMATTCSTGSGGSNPIDQDSDEDDD